jgi:hypothetical protein
MSNLCTRCGSERKLSKTWDEEVALYGRTSKITHTEYVCTDPECQKIVEEQIAVQKEKRVAQENQKEREKQERIKRATRAHA